MPGPTPSPSLVTSIAEITPDSATTVLTERSIPAVMMTIVSPTVMIAITDICTKIAEMLVPVRKYGESIVEARCRG